MHRALPLRGDVPSQTTFPWDETEVVFTEELNFFSQWSALTASCSLGPNPAVAGDNNALFSMVYV